VAAFSLFLPLAWVAAFSLFLPLAGRVAAFSLFPPLAGAAAPMFARSDALPSEGGLCSPSSKSSRLGLKTFIGEPPNRLATLAA
jgi:hypothetical protein